MQSYRVVWALLPTAALVVLAVGAKADRPVTPDPVPASAWNLPGKAPHLLAHYLPWYAIENGPEQTTRTWDHWKYDEKGPHHNPEERRADGLRDIASVYYPLIGPYRSWSRAVVRYHLATAKAAGIQGFILDWYGRGSYTDDQVNLLLKEANRLGMRIAICYEEKLNFLWRNIKSRDEAIANATADLKYLYTRYTANPAYLRHNGLPLILNFDGWGQGALGPQYYTPEEWKRIFAALPGPVAYCRQGLTEAFHPEIPGAFQWWSSNANDIRGFADRARQLIGEHRLKFFANMISPGFNDTGVWGWGDGPRVTPRAGLSLLKETFDLSFTANPDLIQIVTWNDFNEGTVVEPTRENGFQYLDAIATWWGEKTGVPVDLAAIRKPFLEYVKTCSSEERAELPPAPYDAYLKPRPLTVEIPHYLEFLSRQKQHASIKP